MTKQLLISVQKDCSVSSYLFLIVSQLLANHIKASAIKGMTIINRELVIAQLADDTTPFPQNENQIPIAIKVIKEFSEASGVHLNVMKCELFVVKECSVASHCNIPVKYIGILISKNQLNRSTLNCIPIIPKKLKGS